MATTELIGMVIEHKNARDFIRELLNGTNAWLFDTLAELETGKKPDEVRAKISSLVRDYLETLYRLQRQYSITYQSYIDFLQKDKETPKNVMAYLLKTFRTRYDSAFLPASIALLIALERKEGDYKRFQKELMKAESTPISPAETLTTFYAFILPKPY